MQHADFKKLLADTLAAHGRSPRTQETYTLMRRLFGRHLEDKTYGGRTLDIVMTEDVEAYQRKRRTVPEILSPEEVRATFESCNNLSTRQS